MIEKYFLEGFISLTGDEENEILDYLYENAIDTPKLYRGMHTEVPEIDDEIELHDMRGFASMTEDKEFSWNFGNVILVVEDLEGIKINDDEWIVKNETLFVDEVIEENGFYYVYCR